MSWFMAGGRRRHETTRLGHAAASGAVYESFAPGQNSEILTALRSAERAAGVAVGCARLRQNPFAAGRLRGSGRSGRLFSAGPLVSVAARGARRLRTQPPCCASMTSTRSRAIRTGSGPCSVCSTRPRNCAARLIFAASVAPRQAAWVLEDWRSRAAACVVYQLRRARRRGTHRGSAAARGAARTAIAPRNLGVFAEAHAAGSALAIRCSRCAGRGVAWSSSAA